MKPLNSQIDTLISNHLSGEITPDEMKKLAEWVDEDKSHLSYFMQAKNIWDVSHPPFNPNEINTKKALNKVMQQIDNKKWYQSTFIIRWQQIAAILLIPLITFSTYAYFRNPSENKPTSSFQEVFAPYGAYTSLTLPDNSKVWLNAGSSLKYPTLFLGNKRDVFLSGEAYFEVESDKNNSFEVHTGKISVTATGTKFNVQAYQSDSVTTVTMIDGKVKVGNAKINGLSLFPGDQIAYNNNTSKYDVHQTNTYKWCSWKDGKMMFRDDPLEYVFKRLGLTFNIDISVKDKTIAQNLYRATFEDESLDEILRLLEMTAPIRYKEIERIKSDDNSFCKRKIEVYKAL